MPTRPIMTPALSLDSLTDDALFRHVSDALKQVHSVLLLARSPLADSQLVLPALVRDDLSPTAQERGQALRLVLRWAVERLAPATPRHALGEHRPLDDPTWQDPAWWRYNILRHRYLEPLHPDDFVDGGRYTETLLAFTGIPTRDLFYEERSRAIREVAQWLRTQAAGDEATHLLRQLALDEVYAGVRHDAAALHMLTAAATFNDVIPQALLITLAADEGVREPVAAIERLVAARDLLAGDDATLWLSPVLRRFLYQRETPERRRVRHHRIGAYYRAEGDTLRAVYHLQQARDDSAAAALLLADARDLLYEADGDELAATLARFDRAAITPRQWCRLQVLLADVYRVLSRPDEAVAACRAALQAAATPQEQARIYRRLGKLYEQRSQRQALDYYAQAVARFEGTDDGEFVELLKDRAWVQIGTGRLCRRPRGPRPRADVGAPGRARHPGRHPRRAGRPSLLPP
ncbi:MAG: tetratricopeptide repeat protein [Caldilineaceae bacterium]|nr:tetratricopeptide repeat protein [Caldilineaceae bacterium]